jgi:pyruvate formate lyase activating enzyme
MKVNFGGFVPLSTVDWRGRAVCTVFFRGCPVRCPYCHNAGILAGEDFRPVEEIAGMIRSSLMLISGVIFSGGEPTMQKDALVRLAGDAKKMGLLVGVQTNGVYPGTLESLISGNLVDRVALDIKARWERYNNLLNVPCVEKVRESLSICKKNYKSGNLPEFEVVVTLFRGYEDEVPFIAREAGDVPIVLQQGVQGAIPPLTEEEMKNVADRLPGLVRIRTREGGEIAYEGNRGRRIPCER